MNLGRYRLLSQRGAGPDGAAYRAQGDDGEVELRVLTAARENPERLAALRRRLPLVARLEYAACLHVHELALEHDPPFVVLEAAPASTLDEALRGVVPLRGDDALRLGLALSSAVAGAHRLGLALGGLAAHQVYASSAESVKLDATGLDTVATEAARTARWAGDGILAHAADLYGLGMILAWLLTGRRELPAAGKTWAEWLAQHGRLDAGMTDAVAALLGALLAQEPADRPLAAEVERTLSRLVAPVAAGIGGATVEVPAAPSLAATRVLDAAEPSPDPSPDPLLARGTLGRFRLVGQLGEGGMGAVYRAEDPVDGTTVAVKVLRRDWAQRPEAVRRFHKEARLLAEVNNPYVANLLAVNEEDGIHYLVLEFVAGTSVGAELARRGKLDEPEALAIIADVSRALADAHERGIVHRDVKPDNVLLMARREGPPRVKLSDFGLARHVVETESLNVTQAGALLGTPYYMAPEQCAGGAVDVRADVYALGATLFHLLAGRPPFVADSPLALLAMHRNDAPPSLKKLNPAVSDAADRLVGRMLAKLPEARPAGAGAVLEEVERILRGEASDIAVHPRLPAADPARVLEYDWTWELEASPRELWPHVSNTERLNRAVGLPAIDFTTRPRDGGGAQRFGQVRRLGLTIGYEEHPFEWVEGRRMGVLRQFSRGPFRWLVSALELAPRPGGGTTLTHRVRVEPSGIVGRTAAAVEVGIKGRRGLDRVYRRIDAAVTGRLGRSAAVDPFEEPAPLSAPRRQRLERFLTHVSDLGIDPAVAEPLADFLAHAPAQEVARIRPLALARRLGAAPDDVITACLHAARDGLLILLWDILCPVCRIPSQVQDTLRALQEHGRCEACSLDFELDFANSVEMIFRAHPGLRETELATYCVGGPAHSPHVVAQVRLGPRERFELELALEEGSYRLRGPQLPFVFDFRAEALGGVRRLDMALPKGPAADTPRVVRAGGQVLALTNAHDGELVVRVERAAARTDALTAARAASLAMFRELFPGEVLSPGRLVSVATVTLLVTELEGADALYRDLGDSRAFVLIHEHFRIVGEAVKRHGGALVKTVGEGVLAVFSDTAAAVEAALALQGLLDADATTRGLRLRTGVHRGPALVANLNDHLDYFGTTAHQSAHLLASARAGEVLLTEPVTADPQAAALLQARSAAGTLDRIDLPGRAGMLVMRCAAGGQARTVDAER